MDHAFDDDGAAILVEASIDRDGIVVLEHSGAIAPGLGVDPGCGAVRVVVGMSREPEGHGLGYRRPRGGLRIGRLWLVSDGPLANLSVSIVCFNSERTMRAVVDSIAGLAGEVIAVDSGSTDGTIGVLEAAGAKVIRQPWLGYVKQKQFALEQCSGAWVLHLDADEPVSKELAASVRAAIAKDDPAIGGCEVNRKVIYAGRVLEHAWQPEWRLRLVRRGAARWGGFDPHDKLELIDPARHRVEKLRGALLHDTMPSMGAFLERQAQHATTAAVSLAASGTTTSPLKLITSPTGALLKQLVLRSAWRDGWRGWAAAGAASASAMMKHLALLERTRCQSRGDGG